MAEPAQAGPPSPYPGTRSFVIGERPRFFGREKETRDLTNLVLGCPLVVLSAQSGAGKTSLIQAGLAPRAAAEEAVVLLARVSGRIAPDRMASIKNVFAHNCLESLRRADDEQSGAVSPAGEVPTLLAGLLATARQLGLRDEAGASTEAPTARAQPERHFFGRPLIVAIDQFEEMFTNHQERWSERRPFFEQLAAALAALPDLRVLISLRDDYVSELDPFAGLLPGTLRTRYRLERLRREQALSAIEKPLGLPGYGYTLRTAIARGLVRDLLMTNVVRTPGVPGTGPIEGEFVEPVHLQVVCGNLWAGIQGATPASAERATRFEADAALAENERELVFTRVGSWYRAESAAVRDVDGALGAIYDRAVLIAGRRVQGANGELRLRTLMDEDLITVGKTRGLIDAGTAAAKGVADAALDVLEAERILRREPRAGAAWYELTHDRFIEPVRASNAAWREARRRPRQRAVAAATIGLIVAAAVTAGVSLAAQRAAEDATLQANQAQREAEKVAKRARDEAAKAKTTGAQATETASTDTLKVEVAKSELEQAIANAKSVTDLKRLKQTVKPETLPEGTDGDSPARQKARSKWNQGYAAYREGKENQAVRFYTQAIEADPSYAPAYHSLGVIEHNGRHLQAAAERYDEVIARDPNYVLTYVTYSNLELQRNNPDRALKLAQRALVIRPGYLPAKRAAANAQARLAAPAAQE